MINFLLTVLIGMFVLGVLLSWFYLTGILILRYGYKDKYCKFGDCMSLGFLCNAMGFLTILFCWAIGYVISRGLGLK